MPELYKTKLFSDANLNLYYRLEGNSQSAKNTLTGTDTDITYNASYGKFGQGASFNGSSSMITFADDAKIEPTGNFSVGCWFQLTGTITGYNSFISTHTYDPAGVNVRAGYLLAISDSSKLTIISGKNTGASEGTDFKTVQGSTTITADSKWHFAVGVYDGSNLKVYLDGKENGTASWSNAAVYKAANYPTLGAGMNDSLARAFFFQGYIDEAFVFGKALTATEVKSLYASQGFAMFL